MSNAFDDVVIPPKPEGLFITFVPGVKRLVEFVGKERKQADPDTIAKGYADKDGYQIEIEFKDLTDGKQKFYNAKDGSSKLVQELKKLPSLKSGDILTIEKLDQWNFSVSAGGEATKTSEVPF